MWRAAGADPAEQPANWRALPGTREFADQLSATLIPGFAGDDLFHVEGRVYHLTYTDREDGFRYISLRMATTRETERYFRQPR